MKRYGEKATREALTQGATIRKYDDPMRGPVWRVRQNGEILGYITFDLYTKLYHDGSIERIDSGFMFTDYAAPAPKQAPGVYLIRYTFVNGHETGPDGWDNVEATSPEEAIQILREIDLDEPLEIHSVERFDSMEEAVAAGYAGNQAAQQPEEQPQEIDWNAASDRVHAAVSAWLAKAGLLAEPQAQPQEAPQPEPKYYRNCETQETTNSATEAMGWHRAGVNVTVCQRLADDHVRIVRIDGAAQPDPETEDQENRKYVKHVAEDIEAHYYDYIRRCPCCEAIVERDDWDDLDVFTCPHCGDLDDVGQWEPLSLHEYLSDVLDVTYIVGSDRQTLEGARFYVTLGGPTVWVDTCSRSVELRWGGRSASWGLSFALCDELDEIAQEWWDMG